VANGGHLLVDGTPDVPWARQVRCALDDGCLPLDDAVAALRRATDGHRAGELRVADDLFAYVAVEREGLPAEVVSELSAWGDQAGWRVSLQGRRLYCVPRPLTKEAAVAEVSRRAGTTRLLAAGDSLLDAQLLEAADVALRPAHGELHELGWHRPHLRVTAAAGVLAGEEIARRALDDVRGRRPDEIVNSDHR
jgi:hypothetical protein